MKLWQKIIFIIILFFYIYFRITPIINETVPYTYDQGRDFLKTQEIVKTGNIPFIGPTTGLEGIFHGAWIYYLLSIPYILTSGSLLSFYYFFFFINLGLNLLFFYFAKKYFGLTNAFLFLTATSISDYFIKNSFFPSNDHLAPFFMILFIYFSYSYFLKKSKKDLFFIGLFSGFILESEFAFGLFLIPSVLFSFFIIEKKDFIKKIHFFIIGSIIPILPRILFEIKNNFLQTKNFLKYFFENTNNKIEFNFLNIFKERLFLFFNYINDIFVFKSISIFFILILFISLIYLLKNKKNEWLKFSLLIICFIFILSFIYKKGPFYSYYLGGIQYLFLTIFLFVLNKQKKLNFFLILLILFYFFINTINFKNSILNKKIPFLGLRADNNIIKYLIKKTNNQDFCLKIYTPPVIPYTYQYLLNYYNQKKLIKIPKNDFYKNQCYMIIDFDQYQFRIDEWRKNNIPKEAYLLEKKVFENKTLIELYEIKK
ncbi:MAG: glycosyltransferase family 39 protein [Patescibacteria group bacterium]|nr:glycosyltransferase family 39 protein [Patescibacteria group bacterium]